MDKLLFAVFCAVVIFASVGCGKKGPPEPPEEARNYYGISR